MSPTCCRIATDCEISLPLDLDGYNNEAALKDALALLQKLETTEIPDKHVYVGDLYWCVFATSLMECSVLK